MISSTSTEQSGAVAVDAFAGAGGWDVACRRLGVRAHGIELMKEAILTREANDLLTVYRDIWVGLETPALVPWHALYIASPPCQTFSNAGNGEGREAMEQVLAAIDDGAYMDVARLRALGEATDPRTALVLTPLAHVYAHRPRLVAFEQVPPVMPVWIRCAQILRLLGYSVWTGILHSEQYGVPQTRDRAILMARLDGMVDPPVPTHSRYYSASPKRLDRDVLKWVSMAEALGWGATARPAFTLTGGGASTGGYEPFPTGARNGMAQAQAQGDWVYVNGNQANAARRSLDQPAPTIHFGAASNDVRWHGPGNVDPDGPVTTVAGGRLTARGHHNHGEQGKTVDSASVRDEYVRLITNQDSDLGHGKKRRYSRQGEFPSPTITSQVRSFKKSTSPDIEDRRGVKVTVEEASLLQSFPVDFVWKGPDTKKFLQIGNAVPPLMAEAILAALLTPARERTEWDSVFAEVAA